jgi:hypothetical protein
MATVVHQPKQTSPNLTDDPFHDPLLKGVGVAFIVLALVVLALTGLLIWGVQYGTPPWSANSFPPPIVH